MELPLPSASNRRVNLEQRLAEADGYYRLLRGQVQVCRERSLSLSLPLVEVSLCSPPPPGSLSLSQPDGGGETAAGHGQDDARSSPADY